MTKKGEKCEGLADYWQGFREAEIDVLISGIEIARVSNGIPRDASKVYRKGYYDRLDRLEKNALKLMKRNGEHNETD